MKALFHNILSDILSVDDIIKTVANEVISMPEDISIRSVSIDSRTLTEKDLFVPIKGKNFDGHRFILEALQKGASAVLVSEKSVLEDERIRKYFDSVLFLEVSDTIEALLDLAAAYRRNFSLQVIAITGSAGKTTTKDMIAHTLSSDFRVHRNSGNQNNFIGVAMTIFGIERFHDVAVVELGTSSPGEIERLAGVVKPDFSVITNIGPAHLEFFKNIDEVYKEKINMLKSNGSREPFGILNADDPYLRKYLNRPRTCSFGILNDADFHVDRVEFLDNSTLFRINGSQWIAMPLLGKGNIYNAAASIAVCANLGMDVFNIRSKFGFLKPTGMRLERKRVEDINFIIDCYNANPVSMDCALDVFSRVDANGKKVVVVGDMCELGDQTEEFHSRLGQKIAMMECDELITIGPLARITFRSFNRARPQHKKVFWFESVDEAKGHFKRSLSRGDAVLLKGSRSVKLERILDCFTTFCTR